MDYSPRQDDHVKQVAEQKAKLTSAERLRDKAEAIHISALELELDYARAQHAKRLRKAKDNPYSAAMFRTSEARQNAHAIFAEAEEIAFFESERASDLVGEPDFEAVGERVRNETVRWQKFYADLREHERSTTSASKVDQVGLIGEMLDAANAVIDMHRKQVQHKLSKAINIDSADDADDQPF